MTYYIAIVLFLFLGYYIWLIFFSGKESTINLDDTQEEEIIYEPIQPTIVNEDLIFNSPTIKGGKLPLSSFSSSETSASGASQKIVNSTDSQQLSLQSQSEGTSSKAIGTIEYLTLYDIDFKSATIDGAAMFSKVAV